MVELSLDSTDEDSDSGSDSDSGDKGGRAKGRNGSRHHRPGSQRKHSALQEPSEWQEDKSGAAEGMRAPNEELAKLAASLPTVEQLLATGRPDAHRVAQVSRPAGVVQKAREKKAWV